MLLVPTAARAAVSDDEIYSSFTRYFAPSQQQRARAAARLSASPAAPDRGASMAILEVVRNWDDLGEDTRRKLSEYIYVGPWRNGQREVRSITQNGCAEVISESEDTTMDTAHFRAVFDSSASSQHYAAASFVTAVLQEAEYTYSAEVGEMGLPAPRTEADGKTRILFCDLIGATGGVVGYTFPELPRLSDLSVKTHIDMDNDYAGIYTGTTPVKYAGLTFAHEFFHAIQWGINYDAPSLWLMESNATWIEEELYPDVNDYVNIYLEPRFDNSNLSLDFYSDANDDYQLLPYGSSIFFRNITENELDVSYIAGLWAELKTTCAPPSTVFWCTRTVTEWPLLESTLQAAGKPLPAVFRNYSVANYTHDYHDGNLAAFPDVPTTTETLSPDAAAANGALSHMATDYYQLDYKTGGKDLIELTFSGTESAQWQVAAIGDDGDGGFTIRNMSIASGEGSLTMTDFGFLYNKLVVAVSNADTVLDNQAYSLTFMQKAGNYVTLQHTYSSGWQIIGAPLTVTGAYSPEDAFGLPGAGFFQLKNGSYILEDLDLPSPGLGYWTYFETQTGVSVRGIEPTSGSVQLQAGWNLVSPPYNQAAVWGSDISVSNGYISYAVGDAEALDLIDDTIYTYDGSQEDYSAGHAPGDGYSLQAWTGFAIYAQQDCALIFPAP